MKWALLFIALLAAPALAQPAAPGLPEGCREEDALVICEWTVDTRTSTANSYSWKLPPPTTTLATVTVVLDGQDGGWQLGVWNETRRVSEGSHQSSTGTAPGRYTETSVHLLLDVGEPEAWSLVLKPYSLRSGGFTFDFLPAPNQRSLGVFRILYVAEALPEGTPPLRPAATADVPHLADLAYDSALPEMDIVAAWFDDASVGDALFEARLRVLNASELHYPSGLLSSYMSYGLSFRVLDERYYMGWIVFRQGEGSPGLACQLAQFEANTFRTVLYPDCAFDQANGTLVARIPERSVGTPGRGVPFTEMSAFAGRGNGLSTEPNDNARTEQFPFALGGPAVWDELNACAFCPIELQYQWYEDPLARDNLDTTLQVVGSTLAGGTFLVGLIIVRRRRDRTRDLLDEIDKVEARGETRPREALLDLGMLESRFTQLFRKGDLHESQYQVVSQRIASVATRLALRRELGLDDGSPDGLAPPSGSAGAHAVQVPVRSDPPEESRVRP